MSSVISIITEAHICLEIEDVTIHPLLKFMVHGKVKIGFKSKYCVKVIS